MTPASRARLSRSPVALQRRRASPSPWPFAAPVLYVAWRALTLGGDRREVLEESLAPAWRTVQLAAIVTLPRRSSAWRWHGC